MSKILLVDDEPSVRISFQMMLKKLGHSVTLAENGVDALQRFNEDPADLIISDLTMPGMNGVQFVTKLRALSPNVPIIVCTGNASYELLALTAKSPPLLILEKPFDYDQLKDLLTKALADS